MSRGHAALCAECLSEISDFRSCCRARLRRIAACRSLWSSTIGYDRSREKIRAYREGRDPTGEVSSAALREAKQLDCSDDASKLASREEAVREYARELAAWEELPVTDALMLAVPHRETDRSAHCRHDREGHPRR